ncbi:uncharacterized protein N7498_006044 [Penicillium cinerascens]|uniref:Ecp2 effector protein domain-containing protein n=1 Tax=Penicillium cinerascens TaxID=70096 RepID=A0A9W9SX23_9EURO|nr:uncharacterized protein N7498_006044 [Penicillium cinerascens]KAJ5201381.1 hypothetical protein N7498_006044 [Penicillium cinerascens]
MIFRLFSLFLMATVALAVVFPGGKKPCTKPLPQSKWSQAIQKSMKEYPKGNNPKINFKPPVWQADTLKSITFYATGGCHGAGADATTYVPRKDFNGDGSKQCSGSKGHDKGGLDDLEDNGASFILDGNIASNCQLHFFGGLGCDDKDWLGFMSAADQKSGCSTATNSQGKLIPAMRSFNYVCDNTSKDDLS